MALSSPLPDKDDPVWSSPNGFVVRKDEGVTRLTGHETFAVKVTGEETDGALAFMSGLVEPGHGNVPHIHSKEDEAFYVLTGEFEFLNGNQRFTAHPGDFIYIPKGTRHAFRNLAQEPARLLVFYTPAGPEVFFLNYGSADGPPEPWTQEKFDEMTDAIGAHNMVLLPGDDWH
ncbi:cupin domain-containing protein [Streptomyces mutabilis]|uniref:Cupin domain-containing protein n=1 Tax=Streptomyces griseiscabiei TaxID=2993540 RepID=A0ABU4LDN5_9ACTN|nr:MULTISPECIES: cupin domain-containing protein [Streptomyces]AHE39953.1 Cupin 2, barrel [Streptomyces sp. F8]MBZ3908372.1 cupin domain-containing protein [Streptomyces griseiscabiei]MDX2913887.1 cupin domain-containing protein [Streptomyces griseiscabiei]